MKSEQKSRRGGGTQNTQMSEARLFIRRCSVHLVGGSWLILERTILSLLVDSVPLRSEGGLGWAKAPKRRLRKGWKAWSAELTGRYHNPSATGDPQDLARLPRWVCYLRAAAETRSTFIAQKQTHSPFPPPELETSECKHIWILSILRLWPAGGHTKDS